MILINNLIISLKTAVNWLSKANKGCGTVNLEDNDNHLVAVISWESGFAVDDPELIHSNLNPSLCLCAAVRVHNKHLTTDFDVDFTVPWNNEFDAVTVYAISPNEDYNELAN